MQNAGEYGSGGFPKENGGVQPPRQSRNLPKANTFAEVKISIIVKTPRPVGRGVRLLTNLYNKIQIVKLHKQ